MKKILSLCLAVLLVFAIAPMAFANISVTLDGAAIEFDVPPQMIDSRTMVPLRAIFEALDAEIDWDGDTQTVTATRGATVVVMQVGNPVINVAGSDVTLDVSPVIVDGRTLVPARAVAESFGVNVEWDGDTQTVVLSTGYTTAVTLPGTVPNETAEVDNSLIGEWYMYHVGVGDFEENFRYFFYADGTGRSGIPDLMISFLWTISENGYLMLDLESIGHSAGFGWDFAVRYSYSISGNTLTLESLDAPGFQFDYIRAN